MENITRQDFFNFLKKHHFYKAWINGYDLDNEIYDHYVEYDTFFFMHPRNWLYSGCGALAMINNRPSDMEKDLQKRFDDWRNKYSKRFMRLDEQWIQYVQEHNKI